MRAAAIYLEEDMCIAVGDMATYAVETNKARPATREEVMEILQRAEENGFVHQITNIGGEDKTLGICTTAASAPATRCAPASCSTRRICPHPLTARMSIRKSALPAVSAPRCARRMLMLGIPSFRLEKEVVNAEIEILREMGVKFQYGVEVGKDVTIAQLRDRATAASMLPSARRRARRSAVRARRSRAC